MFGLNLFFINMTFHQNKATPRSNLSLTTFEEYYPSDAIFRAGRSSLSSLLVHIGVP